MPKPTKQDVIDATGFLKNNLKEGDTVYGIVTKVARSGMSRKIKFFLSVSPNEILDISWRLAAIIGYSYDKDDYSVKINGGGMDMLVDAIQNLSQALFGDYNKLNSRRL